MSEGGEVRKGTEKGTVNINHVLVSFLVGSSSKKHLGEYKLNSNKVGTEMIEMFSLSQSSFKMD